jgi:homoserine kinase type II
MPHSLSELLLAHYGSALPPLKWFPITSGFSGAQVWRGDDEFGAPRYALKRWPAEITSSRIGAVHAWLTQARHLSFVPALIPTISGLSWIEEQERVWDLSRWLPGQPRLPAGRSEVENACVAVAHLHRVWSPQSRWSLCPGLLRRIEVLTQWLTAPPSRDWLFHENLADVLERAFQVVTRTAPAALQSLKPWEETLFSLHPCVRDLRGEHILFSGERVTGIVDFGAMAVDSPAGDLARVLGDLAAENDELFARGLEKYRQERSDFTVSDDFVRRLDRAGVICSLIGWFARLLKKQMTVPDKNIRIRLTHLLARAEQRLSF